MRPGLNRNLPDSVSHRMRRLSHTQVVVLRNRRAVRRYLADVAAGSVRYRSPGKTPPLPGTLSNRGK